jgi:hypothetical protein
MDISLGPEKSMITAADLAFHTPDGVDRNWAETYWFGCYVPEENLYGWVYMVFRAGTGAMTCDIEFIDRKSARAHDSRYVDIQHHIPIPERLQSFSLPNGLEFQAKSVSEYRIDYVGVDDTEIHLDFSGIHEPYDIHDPNIDPLAKAVTEEAVEHSGFGTAYANHFDLTMRATGTIKVRGKEYVVNSLVTNDHSWGPRFERGMRMMAYMNAHFNDDDYVVQTIWEFDASKPDGEQHVFKHGYAIVNGRLLGGITGSLKVVHDDIFPRMVEVSFTDIEGTVHNLQAEPLAFNSWVPYGCCLTGHSMLSWRTAERTGGVGTLMEAYPLDTVTGDFLHPDIRASSRS